MFQRYFLAPLAALLLLATTPRLAQAQTGGVGIGTTAPDASAALEVSSTSKGLLPPRLSPAQRDAIASPATGLIIYNTFTNKLNTWNGTSWDASLSATEQPVQTAGQTFAYTGGVQTYTVPAGVTSLRLDAAGAQGGASTFGAGGGGARVQATLLVTPGEVLTIYVGGAGSQPPSGSRGGGGYNGGGNGYYTSGYPIYRGAGGGGASDVRRSATAPSTALVDRLLVAAGGGGGADYGGGGSGGAPYGANGAGSGTATPGTGATPSAAGSLSGTLGNGGDAPLYYSPYPGGGGGGGGYYGGGGGDGGGAGGGGSSWVTSTGSSVGLTSNYQTGNGVVVVTPVTRYAAPALDGSNFVNVPGTWGVNGTSYYYAGGNVGIGTSSPGQRLEVAGTVFSSSGGFRFPDGSTQTTAAPNAVLNQATLQNGANFNIGGNGAIGGTLGVGTTTPAASAQLEVASTTKGLLPPRLSTAQRDAIGSPAGGLLVYNTDTKKLQVWNGTSWTETLTTTETPYQNPARTFAYTGGVQTYTVPTGVSTITIDAVGAQGGEESGLGGGGLGARVQTTLAVTAGEVLSVLVGGAGRSGTVSGGYNGGGSGAYSSGGGGGATDIRRGAATLNDRLVVAAGGGGGGSCTGGVSYAGGGGGAPNGGNGAASASYQGAGMGATQTAGGTGTATVGGSAGSFGQGGSYYTGGGGGYYGGGAGVCSGAGGGSSWVLPTGTSATTLTAATNSGNGQLTLTPGPARPAPVLDATNFTNLPWTQSGAALYPTTLSNSVGIGTSTPGQKLEVAGQVFSSTGGFRFPDNTVQTTAGLTSGSAVLNQTSPQASSNFNISGTGTVGGQLTAGSATVGGSLTANSASITGNTTVGGSLGVGISSPAGQLANTAGNVLATDGNGISTQGLGWVNTKAVGYAGVFYNARSAANGNGLAVKVASASAVALDVSQGSSAATAGTALLRVQGSGQVGIGTSSPTQRLDVDGGILARSSGLVSNQGAHLQWNRSGDQGETWLLNQNGSGAGGIRFGQSNTATTGTNTVAEWARFDGSGNLGLGTTSPGARLSVESSGQQQLILTSTSTDPTGILTLNFPATNSVSNTSSELVIFSKAGTTIGQIVANLSGNSVSYTTASDQRMKEHIEATRYGLADLLKLRVKDYNFIGTSQRTTGLLAQELFRVYPDAVKEGDHGPTVTSAWAVDYGRLTPLLVQAVQDQQQQLEAQRREIAALKAQAAAAATEATAAKAQAAIATATLETFEARLRRLEAAGAGQAQR